MKTYKWGGGGVIVFGIWGVKQMGIWVVKKMGFEDPP